ncbi:MAG: ferric iron reductase [Bacteriovoracia bacterium]
MKYFLLLSLFLTLSSAFALTPEVKQLVRHETKSNGVSVRAEVKIALRHFEIPVDEVALDISERLPPEVRESLLFTKNGRQYLRWLINPEDRKWYREVKAYLKKKNLDNKEYKYFDGYQTASRSYIVEDPKSHAEFSLKVSTDTTGGHWKDKKQTAQDAIDVRRSTDFVVDLGRKEPFRNFVLLDEPAAFTLPSIDQGVIVRTLYDLPDSQKYYLPGFSAVHTQAGEEIAKLNGATNVAAFWEEHYVKPLARSLAELAARAGIAYDSPHSQNFLVELDADFRPTGKIVLRDLGDIFLTPELTVAAGGERVVKRWPEKNITRRRISAGVGILHGNVFPSWLDEAGYDKWGKTFFQEYEKELTRITGVSSFFGEYKKNLRYFSKAYYVDGSEWQKYITRVKAARVNERWLIPTGVDCANAFSLMKD